MLGYAPTKTTIRQLPKPEWQNYQKRNNLKNQISGIYLPRNQTAIIQKNDPLGLFHEYYGHGLYCEKTQTGQKIVSLEKELLREEQKNFKGNSLSQLIKFRKDNTTHQKLIKYKNNSQNQFEIFAILTEYLLSRQFGIEKTFRRKYEKKLNENYINTINDIIDFKNQHGNTAMFYELGLARNTNPKTINKLLQDIYGQKTIKKSKLILLTGSQKPFSDIDLFSSSNYLASTKNDWLDLVNFDEKDFERRISLFEVQVTHPLLKGKFIAGDKKYLEEKKKQLFEQPITQEAIEHNLNRIQANEKWAQRCKDQKEKKLALSYAKSYKRNAELLKQGKREGLTIR